ncbi:TlpA family protein disulfide reductase [Dyadobacter arcticus]|uniref:Thiol-disulfide isomerase/thioredoxin n=1 Tax=Dyadobacter arcticus TaxID=1078754 RepID=A0ABX0USN2_9BACT|nr:TlpA disulfide reductase family protein [Dyadobacter arcticus]NIJ54655.1 thiol-disulfide isomerase/thioredoxin [Dyadobacter arcticus]
MKKIVLSSFGFFILLCCAQAQKPELPKLSAGDYFNNFQRFTNESPNINAAFINVQKLASNPEYEPTATFLIHNSFAQDFVQRSGEGEAPQEILAKRRWIARPILDKMLVDTSILVKQQVQPLFLLIKVQEAANDLEQLTRLTNEFITSEIDGHDVYRYRAGRYGLSILNVIRRHSELTALSLRLTNKLEARLRQGQVIVTDSSSRADLDKRAWFRFLFASVNFLKSEQTTDPQQKETLLKAAFEYSPDLVDKNHQSGYFYDMRMLWGNEKEGFQDEYLKFITASTDKKQVMITLLKMALVEPSFKENLRAVHGEVMPGTSFGDYWKEGIDASAIKAPPVTLKLLAKNQFSSQSYSGQWILVDFWGTWCKPCREEHPALQKFYDSTAVKKSKNITLLTIACRDTEEKVMVYMTKMRYSFPVAMSDNKIEKSFKVLGYPTKILITPTGKYITVPFGVDWVSFVNKYVETN